MKLIDLTQTGGYPFEQDTLNYMQTSYKELFAAVAGRGLDPNAGPNTPVRIAGMLQDGMGSINSGWFLYNGELIAFTGSSIPLFLTGSEWLYVDITTSTTNVTYLNSSVAPSISDKNSSISVHPSFTGNTSTSFAYSSLQEWGRELAVTAITINNVTSANLTGTILYRKNFLNNTMQLIGNLSTTTAGSIASTPAYETVCQFPLGYRPSSAVNTLVQARGAIYELDASGNRMDAIFCDISSNGYLALTLIKPASGQYQVIFNIIVPLD